MSFLNAKTTWANKDFIPFKLCIASIYIIAGSYFHSFFKNYYVLLGILFVVTTVWTVALWLKKMKNKK